MTAEAAREHAGGLDRRRGVKIGEHDERPDGDAKPTSSITSPARRDRGSERRRTFYHRCIATRDEVAVSAARPADAHVLDARPRFERLTAVLLFALSIAAALAFWELMSRTGVVSQRDLPAMSTTLSELWSLMKTGAFWIAFAQTRRVHKLVRGSC